MYQFQIIYGKGAEGTTITEEITQHQIPSSYNMADLFKVYGVLIDLLNTRGILDQVRSITRVDEGFNS